MRAVVITRSGGPEVLELQEVPDPTPGPNELLVRVEAAGVNYRDVYERVGGGMYDAAPGTIAGVEGAGTIVSAGAGVEGFAVGGRVAWVAAQGSYAELVLVGADKAVPVPDDVSSETAAALLLQGMTAHYLASDSYRIQPGDWVLVHAAAGGVGLLLTQIAKLRGGRVIATTSGGEKAELARGAGADEVIGYEGYHERARELTGSEGVAAVYDGIGKTTFDDGLKALRPTGTMVLYGSASGAPDPVDVRVLAARGSLYVQRPVLGTYTRTRELLLARAGELLEWVRAGSLDVRVGATYSLEDAAQSHEDLEARRTTGKLLLIP
jgi:NADPH2:quinone reductase